MRKNVWILMLAVWMLGFAACSDDDDDKKGKSLSEEVAGTYTGTLVVKMGETAADPVENQKISMTSTGENTLTMELKDFKFMGLNVGSLSVPNVRITEGGSVTGSASDVPILEGAIKADIALNGTLKDNKANLTIMVSAPMAGTTEPIAMTVTFEGKK